MLRFRLLVLIPLLMIFTLVASAVNAEPQAQMPMGEHTAKVLEHMDSGGYTYIKVSENKEEYWIATSQRSTKVGEEIRYTEQMWMANFTSKTLGRTFDRIMFVSGAHDASQMPATHASMMVQQKSLMPEDASNAPVTPVGPAEDLTIEAIFAKKDKLKGKQVRVRGEVVKVSKGIMGVDWVHIEDGTGGEDSNHLIFRTKTTSVTVGTTVTAQGRVDTDLDFGYGYSYSVLVEDSVFTK